MIPNAFYGTFVLIQMRVITLKQKWIKRQGGNYKALQITEKAMRFFITMSFTEI